MKRNLSYYYFIEEDTENKTFLVYVVEKKFFDKNKYLGFFDEDSFFELVEKCLEPKGFYEFSENIFEADPNIYKTKELVEKELKSIPFLEKSSILEKTILRL